MQIDRVELAIMTSAIEQLHPPFSEEKASQEFWKAVKDLGEFGGVVFITILSMMDATMDSRQRILGVTIGITFTALDLWRSRE